MFRLSRKGEYALRTVFHLSVRDNICTTEEIATAQDIPQPFLKKIIQALRVAGIVTSAKGQKGGVRLKFRPEQITVRSVIEGVEGPLFLNDCLVCKGTCPRDQICPLHEMWQKSQRMILEILDSNKFDTLVDRHVELVNKKRSEDGPIPPSIAGIMNLMPEYAYKNGNE